MIEHLEIINALSSGELREVSTMTKKEFEDICSKLSADIYTSANIVARHSSNVFEPAHIQVLQNRIITNTLKFNDGIELIKAGFSPFNNK